MRGSSRPRRIPVVITVSEALSIIAKLEPLGTELVPVADAAGRVLAREIRADRDWPPFETSAMDGYAVRLSDVSKSGVWLTERAAARRGRRRAGAADRPGRGRARHDGSAGPEEHRGHRPRRARAARGRPRAVRRSSRRRRAPAPARGDPRQGREASRPRAGACAAPTSRSPPSPAAIPFGSFAGPASRSPSPETRSCLPPQSPARGRSGTRTGRCSRRSAASAAGSPRSPGASPTTPRASRASSPRRGATRTSCSRREACPRETWTSCRPRPSARASRCSSTASPCGPASPSPWPAAAGPSGSGFPAIPSRPRSASTSSRARRRAAWRATRVPRAPVITARLTRAASAPGPRETYRDAWWRIDAGKSLVEPIASAGSHDIGALARANALIRLPARSPRRKAGSAVDCLVIGRIESPR